MQTRKILKGSRNWPQLNIYLRPDLRDRLYRQAEREESSVAVVLHQAIEEWLERREQATCNETS